MAGKGINTRAEFYIQFPIWVEWLDKILDNGVTSQDILLSLSAPCWGWPSKPDNSGYGRCTFRGKRERIHRVSYMLMHNCEIADDMDVMHKCDNRMCGNPFHLTLGTDLDNWQDMRDKGRARPETVTNGVSHAAKLSHGQVAEIRDRYAAGGITQYQLADEYGVHQATICEIVNGAQKKWKV